MGCIFSSTVVSTASPHPRSLPAQQSKITTPVNAAVALTTFVPRHLFFGNSLLNTFLPSLHPAAGSAARGRMLVRPARDSASGKPSVVWLSEERTRE